MSVSVANFGLFGFAFPAAESSGDADNPAPYDVRDGIVYGGGQVGTLLLPSVIDVRLDIPFGGDGNEFAGTLYVTGVNPGLALDTSQDYLVWENREPVTFSSRGRGARDYAITDAKRRALSYKELAASNGVYTGQDLVWLLPAVLTPAAPKLADKIIDAETVKWTVLEQSLNKLTQTWRLVTRNLVLAYQLRDLVDIQRPTVTYDAAGGAVRAWPDDLTPGGSTPYSGLAARVQLLTTELADVFGVRGFQGNYAVTIAEDVETRQGDRIKWGQVYLDIKGQHNPSRIDELPVLDCLQLP